MMTRTGGPSRMGARNEALRGVAQALESAAPFEHTKRTPLVSGEETAIVVVDHRALFRDCLVRCLRAFFRHGRVLAFGSLSEWLASPGRYPSPAFLVVCVSGRHSIDPVLRHELARLSAQRQSPPALIISDTEDLESVVNLLGRAVREFVAKSGRIRHAIKRTRISGSVTSRIQHHEEGAVAEGGRLSARQMAILAAIRQGKGDKQIAGDLRVRQQTVRLHVRNIMKRLNARSLAEVAQVAERFFNDDCVKSEESEETITPQNVESTGDCVMRANSGKLRVIVIDPQKLRQAGLVRLLEGWADANGLDVTTISHAKELEVGPDCAIVVLNLGGTSVLESAPQVWIKHMRAAMPDVPLVILSDKEERSEILAAFGEGATGFITTSLDPSLALEALTFLLRGGSFFPLSALLDESHSVHARGAAVVTNSEGDSHADAKLADCQPAEPPAVANGRENHQTASPLTPRQSEVLDRLRQGKSNKLIARELNMTEATVKVHVRQIMRKFGAANRTQAVLCATRMSVLGAESTSR